MQFRIWSQESVNVNIDFDLEHAEQMEPRPPVKVETALPRGYYERAIDVSLFRPEVAFNRGLDLRAGIGSLDIRLFYREVSRSVRSFPQPEKAKFPVDSTPQYR